MIFLLSQDISLFLFMGMYYYWVVPSFSSLFVSGSYSGSWHETDIRLFFDSLWGTYKHVNSIAASIKHVLGDTADSEICIFQPRTSTYFKTYDGVRVMGDRFLKELYEEILNLKKDRGILITKISIVGYSLGGLVSRYMIGKLYEAGFFENIEPYFFTTFATPHLGVKFFGSYSGPILNFLGSNFIGTSGRDLFIRNKILVELGDKEGPYFKALRAFKQRYLLSNIRHDRTVAFYTSFISDVSPFEDWSKVKLQYLNGIPEIKVGDKIVKPRIIDLKNSKIRPTNMPLPPPTLLSRLRYIGILILISFILPIWFPVVFTANCIGTTLSYFRLTFRPLEFDSAKEWLNLKIYLFGENQKQEIKPTSEHGAIDEGTVDAPLSLHSAKTNDSIISKELAGFTEGAIENMLEAPQMNEDLETVSKSYDNDTISVESEYNFVAGGINNEVFIDIPKHAEAAGKLLSYIDSGKNNELEYPLFNRSNLKSLPFDEERAKINRNLNSLQWFKIASYVDAFNAHDGIVARRGLRSSPRGFATIYLWAALIKDQLPKLNSAPEESLI
ncbi:putative hydrolase [Saccharomycopsis crataegensis]|uniref:Hydrolase n=1 Tax=Saccharomycopsis crataegensis TaxID=43959 RepID=A0AAV5QN45_9ASCO|nr:putative hydrolase [Saccharomycopsis crataegensis]